jgi:hypothetical protein
MAKMLKVPEGCHTGAWYFEVRKGQKAVGHFSDRHWRSLARPVSAALAAACAVMFTFLVLATPARAGTTKVIVDDKQGLDQRPSACGAGLAPMAYFVINQVDAPADAPSSITVNFADASSATYPLLVVDGKAAKYQGPVPTGSYATSATAVVYAAWSGEFVLSHYLCGTTPPTTDPTTSPSTDVTTTSQGSGGSTGPTTSPTTGSGGNGGTGGNGGSGGTTPAAHGGATGATKVGTAKVAAAASQSHFPLAFTGSNLASLVWIALASIVVGLLLLSVKRGRAHGAYRR